MISSKMKEEIIKYTLNYSKGLIEDNISCPELCKAVDNNQITSNDIEEFLHNLKLELLG